MSVALRISVLFLVILGGGFYFFVRTEADETKRHYRKATEEPLVDFAQVLAATVAHESPPDGGSLNTETLRRAFAEAKASRFSAQIYDFHKQNVDLRVYVTDRNGRVVFDSDDGRAEGADYSQWRDVSETLRGRYGARTSRDDPRRAGSILYVAAPIRSGERTIGALTVAKPNDTANAFIAAAEKSTWSLGATVFAAVSLLAVVLSFGVTKPLRALTRYAQAVRDGKRVSLPPLGWGEIQTLGTAFEEMREALEGRRYIERYVQALTHELKSPLTGIRGAVELLREEMPLEDRRRFMENIEREVSRIQHLNDRLLALSSLHVKQHQLETAPVELAAEVAAVVDGLRSACELRDVSFELQAEEPIILTASSFWLREAVANLLHNALEFSPRGGKVRVTIARVGENAILSVADNGPGIPEWAKERIFEQFFSLPRPDTDRRSSGLGLSIVREVALLHGGEALVETEPGKGTTASLVLPLQR